MIMDYFSELFRCQECSMEIF